MKYLIATLALSCCFTTTNIAQKPQLDTSVLEKWPVITTPRISNNGEYALYQVANEKLNSHELYAVSNSTGWKTQIHGIRSYDYSFSNDNKFAYFITERADSLGILQLGTSLTKYIPGVTSFKVPKYGAGQRLAYLTQIPAKQLTVIPDASTKPIIFFHVNNYMFSPDGNLLLILIDSSNNMKNYQVVTLVNFSSGKINNIWKGSSADQFAFDRNSRQLAFTAIKSSDSTSTNSIQYFKIGMQEAEPLITDNSIPKNNQNLFIANDELFFSKDGNKLLISLTVPRQNNLTKSKIVTQNVEIWHYKDPYLPPEQLSRISTNRWALASIKGGKIIWISRQKDRIQNTETFENYLLCNLATTFTDYYDTTQTKCTYLVSAIDGSQHVLMNKDLYPLQFSPDNQFVVWFDSDSLNFFSYEISSGVIRNLSNSLQIPLYDDETLQSGRKFPTPSYKIAGWDLEDHAVLLYDKYDIWKVDMLAQSQPQNVTNYYGRQNHIVFNFLNFSDGDMVVSPQDQPYLIGYNLTTKYNGFWKLHGTVPSNPELLTMDPCTYYIPRSGRVAGIELGTGRQPIKARNANRFIITRMTAAEFPNLIVTEDFKRFHPISTLNPESKYTWIKAQLLSWKIPKGNVSQGILYTPEGFDSTKKYPVIFVYYEKRSDELNKYILPEYSHDQLNIPYFVSNGYIVFVPDIYYTRWHNGESAVNSVVSAAKYLTTFSWVDSTKLGLQGHSFGGWETNFIVTHSHLFAAACEAAGMSDATSFYGSEKGDGKQRWYELEAQGSPNGIGVTPWSNSSVYIQNSPIFYLSDVTTPLLMVHGDKDNLVPFQQGLEMFQGLRRAGKKVWLLEYKNEGHGFYGADGLDYTIRMKEFFDYYLMGAMPPVWMTRGVPVIDKTFESGLEIDESGQKP